MNAPQRPPQPGPNDGWQNLTKLADRIEKHVRWYRWLTLANVIVFGANAAFMLIYLILGYWLRHH
jgi:hypothetical protein